jgi:hypothetical protein
MTRAARAGLVWRPGRASRTDPVVLVLLGPLLLWACGAAGSSATPTAPALVSPVATPSASAAPSPSAGPTGSPDSPASVAVDTTLLSVLPATVAGLTVSESPEGEADAIADPGLGRVGDRVVAALAVDPSSGDFVYAVVVALRPDAGFDDALFRNWRDSFDQGACSQAGGVVGHAEATLGGRSVQIASCEGGVLTYHAWLQERGLLVSASSVGAARLGEQLMGGLTP